jgi:tripartite-type tricarboxylate transporter receptor subunit TctC
MTIRLLALLLSVVWLTATARADDDVAAFYKGNTLRIVVGTAVGGGYDLFARAVARHIRAHIPGEPTVIVQNQPNAGGLAMTNQLFAYAPRDGSVIGAPINGIPTAPLLQPTGVRFDADKLIWLGSTNREPYVAFVWHAAPVQTLAELQTRELLVGATAHGTTMVDFPLVTNDILGTKFKIVRGYEGTSQINIAMERGEIEGNGGVGWAAIKAQVPQWIADKKIKVIAQYGLKRHPDLADVPSMLELAKSDADRRALMLMFARTEYGRPYFLPPEVPSARVAALRQAFAETMRDPGFIADAARFQLDVDPMTGEELQSLIAELGRMPPDVVARVRGILAAPTP